MFLKSIKYNTIYIWIGGIRINYVLSDWMLIATVILPFLFGMLFGIKVTINRLMMHFIKKMPAKDLKKIIDLKGEDEFE